MSDKISNSVQSSFNKFSKHDLENMCHKYLHEKDQNNRKYTKNLICKIFRISRPWFNQILERYKTNSILIAKSRINNRYDTEEYKAKRRQRLIDREVKIAQRKAIREQIKKSRHEHKLPNSMLHMDLKLLPPILGEKIVKGQKQYLLAVVDDCSRKSWFEIINGKNQYQVEAGLTRIFSRMNMTNINAILSDNGKEFKGLKHQHTVEKLFVKMGIKHYYTRVRRPQTNGKVERINRTVSEEFLTTIHFNSRLERELQLRYYEYHYNNDRPHQGIKNQTPNQKYQQLSLIKF
jgi:transposase InsO family protein